jgi:predicted alpha/beta-hydrolase family hydrolase
VNMALHSAIQVFDDLAADPSVRGFLHRPDQPSGYGLVLTHGAGSNCQSPLLVALAGTFAAAGFHVLRCDLPFRQTRPHGPPGPGDAKRDRAGLANAVTTMRKLVSGSVFLGGHSYGGRQSSMLCAEQADLVAGLLLLSYPLHPPCKPEQLRIQHLPALRTPSLFVHGARDPFGSTEEMENALKLIPAKTRLVTMIGAGHDLGFKGKAGSAGLAREVTSQFQTFFETLFESEGPT